jgi:hypothetical protein
MPFFRHQYQIDRDTGDLAEAPGPRTITVDLFVDLTAILRKLGPKAAVNQRGESKAGFVKVSTVHKR